MTACELARRENRRIIPCVSREQGQRAPWWLTLQLWGLDAPLAALAWGLAFATFMDILMITEGPLLLLTSSVWVCTIGSRLFAAAVQRKGWYVQFYRGHLAPMTLLTLCVLAATFWMLFYYVGQIVLAYAIAPTLILLLGHAPLLRRVPLLRGLSQSAAFALACAIPACFFSVIITPIDMLIEPYMTGWGGLMLLMFLYYILRTSWRQGPAEDGKVGGVSRRAYLFVLAFLSVVFVARAFDASSPLDAPYDFTLAIGMACLWVLLRLRAHVSRDALFALGWPLMTLPPLLGMLIYA